MRFGPLASFWGMSNWPLWAQWSLTFNKIILYLRPVLFIPSFAEIASRHEGSSVVRVSDCETSTKTGLNRVSSSLSCLVAVSDTSPRSSSIFVVVTANATLMEGVVNVTRTSRDADVSAPSFRFSIRVGSLSVINPVHLSSSDEVLPGSGVVVPTGGSIFVVADSAEVGVTLCNSAGLVVEEDSRSSPRWSVGDVAVSDTSPLLTAITSPLPPGSVVVRVSDALKPGNDQITSDNN